MIYSCGKHCEKRRNCLYEAIFTFSHNVFYSIWHLFLILKGVGLYWNQPVCLSICLSVYEVLLRPRSSVALDFRSFDPQLGQHAFRGLMIVIVTGFIPLSLLSTVSTGFIPLESLPVVSTMVMWENSQWLGKNIVRRTG